MNIFGVTNAEGQTLSRWDINDILEEMGISEEAIKDGSSAAIENDATKNKIDLTQLSFLAKQHGSELNGTDGKAKEEFDTRLKNLGIPDKIIQQGQKAISAYAGQHKIILPEPPSGSNMNLMG